MIFQFSVNRIVSYNCGKRGGAHLFFFGSGDVRFALDIYFLFFADLLTPREDKRLKDKKLSGVRLRCQIGVFWFCVTLQAVRQDNFGKVLTPLIINDLTILGVEWCQFDKSASDTDELIESQLHSFIGVRSVRLFQEKSIVRI